MLEIVSGAVPVFLIEVAAPADFVPVCVGENASPLEPSVPCGSVPLPDTFTVSLLPGRRIDEVMVMIVPAGPVATGANVTVMTQVSPVTTAPLPAHVPASTANGTPAGTVAVTDSSEARVTVS